MLKLKGQNINQLKLYTDLFIFYAIKWPGFLHFFGTTEKAYVKKKI